MDKTTRSAIKELNNLLRGCEVGVSGYDRYARDAAEPLLKDRFTCYKTEYEKNAREIAGRISAMGGAPRYGKGVAGIVSGMAYAVKGSNGREAPELLRGAHYNETVSIDATERALTAPGLDFKSRELLRAQHRGARARQEELIGLIRDYDIG